MALLPLVLAGHVAVIALLNLVRTPPPPAGFDDIDVALTGGPPPGLPARGGGAPATAPEALETTEDVSTAEQEAPPPEPEPEPSTEAQDPEAPPEPAEPVPEAPPSPERAEAASADVLATVRSMLGAAGDEPAIEGEVQTAAVASGAGGPGETCEITEALQASLQTDEEVHAAVMRIPAQNRSVAGAVLLWDRFWIEDDAIGGPAVMDPIRDALIEGVREAPPECREQWVAGPRFLLVATDAGTGVLAIGSGAWRWADLLPETFSAWSLLPSWMRSVAVPGGSPTELPGGVPATDGAVPDPPARSRR